MRYFKKTLQVIIAAIFMSVLSCSKGSNPEASSQVPNVSVSVNINVNTPPYTPLATVGGVIYLTGGYRGIVVYRYTSSTIVAYDRTCTYDISDANGIVTAQTNGQAICLDCNSMYNLSNGSVAAGPTTIGLKVYATTFSPVTGVLTINN